MTKTYEITIEVAGLDDTAEFFRWLETQAEVKLIKIMEKAR